MFNREILLSKVIPQDVWDVVIIGGGATGLGIAVDAASRGYKTLLLERDDFAKGTSSRSTKLVHGGVRYLAQGNIHLVREALKERGILLKNAPHLTRNESIIIPCYSWFKGLFYTTGLKMYDWLSGKLTLGKSKLISRKKVIELLPNVNQDGLKCGVLYHDGAFDDARLAINLAQTAIEHDAVVLNYCLATDILKEGDTINGVRFEDRESGQEYTVKAKVVVNATGVFADDILRMDTPGARSIIKPSQGVHLVFDKHFLGKDNGIMIPKTDDGRVLFALPWHGKILVGTTDTPLDEHSSEPRALKEEVDFILHNAQSYFSEAPQRSDVKSVYAGLRPLAAIGNGTEKTKEISRGHQVLISGSGLVSVIGGKWTTYRKMAEDTLAKIIKTGMLSNMKCVTENLRVHGYTEDRWDGTHSVYGADELQIRQLIQKNPELDQELDASFGLTKADVVWAVKNEMARNVEDILARRSRILFLDAQAAFDLARPVAELVAAELGRDHEWIEAQIASFEQLASEYMLDNNTKIPLEVN